MKKKITSILLIVFMMLGVLGVTACSNRTTKEESKKDTKVEKSDKNSHYPVTISTYNIAKKPVKVTFDKAPEKVLASCQNSVETLLALGLQDKIVAATGLDHDVKPEYKEAFKKLKYYKKTPTKEEVIGIQPDFILGWYSLFKEKRLGDVDFWHKKGINTYMAQNSSVKKPRTLQNEYNDILNMGKIFNVEDKANKIVNNMKKEIKKAKDLAKGKEKVKTAILEVEKNGVYRVYGEDSMGGDLANQIGADLVANKSGKIGSEDLVKLNPDVIFTVYYGDEIDKNEAVNKFLQNKGLSSVSAIKSKRVNPIMLGEVYSSGIRTLDGIKTITKGLYGDK